MVIKYRHYISIYKTMHQFNNVIPHYIQVYNIPYIRCLKMDKLKQIRINLMLDVPY